MENVKVYARVATVVAHSDELESILGDLTYEVFLDAKANLARHHKTGQHRVTQTKGRVDHYVNLEGPDALAVEVGHHHNKSYEWVEGIHVLTDALRKIGGRV